MGFSSPYSRQYAQQLWRWDAGAGFWLRDASMARAEAEAVAKATYAATRDPSDVALFYMGLGRKPLLQVGFHGTLGCKMLLVLAAYF